MSIGGGLEYRIKWRGWGSRWNTWEPERHIIDQVILTEWEETKARRAASAARSSASATRLEAEDVFMSPNQRPGGTRIPLYSPVSFSAVFARCSEHTAQYRIRALRLVYSARRPRAPTSATRLCWRSTATSGSPGMRRRRWRGTRASRPASSRLGSRGRSATGRSQASSYSCAPVPPVFLFVARPAFFSFLGVELKLRAWAAAARGQLASGASDGLPPARRAKAAEARKPADGRGGRGRGRGRGEGEGTAGRRGRRRGGARTGPCRRRRRSSTLGPRCVPASARPRLAPSALSSTR